MNMVFRCIKSRGFCIKEVIDDSVSTICLGLLTELFLQDPKHNANIVTIRMTTFSISNLSAKIRIFSLEISFFQEIIDSLNLFATFVTENSKE